jgi:hypothetical protein
VRTLLYFFLAAFLTTCSGDGSNTNSSANSATTVDGNDESLARFIKQTIDIPLPEVEIPMQRNQVDARKGGHLVFASNTEIDIPPGAFVYADGQPVEGRVTLDFREFHTPAEVILSGIPMRDWDDKTQSWQNFSTAGMFEIRGVDEEQRPVEIAPEHALEVHLTSSVDGTYGTWYFDEEKGDWEAIGESVAKTFSPTNVATETTALPARPQAPRKYDPSAIRMEFAGMNLSEFPELSDVDKVALQYAGKSGAEGDPAENEWIFTTNWYKAKLTKTSSVGIYNLYLENDDETFSSKVQATLLPAAYPSALEAYQRKVAAYETAVQNMEQSRRRTVMFRRSMQVDRFGIYNYDVYSSWEEPVFANAEFVPATQYDWIGIDQVYLVTDNGRITVRYPKMQWNLFNFDRNRKNLLIGVTTNAEIVIVAPEEFTNQSADLVANTRKQKWECTLEAQAIKVEDPAGLQALIDRYLAG